MQHTRNKEFNETPEETAYSQGHMRIAAMIKTAFS